MSEGSGVSFQEIVVFLIGALFYGAIPIFGGSFYLP